ncbi:MAG: metallophosphoesterase [Steroidobacteraceae bacterium]|nr:metallophosphoesterase [Steroidobacteraceae bacterium]MBP7012233.1 metallophosphoesterase [Steroidobacteraceae bacterium]
MTERAFVSGRSGAALVAVVVLAGCIGTTRPPVSSTLPAVPATGLRVYAVGDIADCSHGTPEDSMAARTSRLVPDGALVLGLGDMAYPLADAQTLASCYEPTWGTHRAMTLATPGNHDYVRGNAGDFSEYFGADPLQDGGFIAFSRALTDDWRLIALDSNVDGSALQAQYEWLDKLLAEAAKATARTPGCLLVMWHAPLYSSGMHRGSGDRMRPFWQLADRHGADLVLSGHEHFYERFDPLDAEGQPPRAGQAPRQFVVGTGGARLYGFWKPPYRSKARVLEHGVLQLSLERGRYSWRFIDVDGRVQDAGVARCRTTVN